MINLQLVKTVDLDPKKNYIFGFHPHGETPVCPSVPVSPVCLTCVSPSPLQVRHHAGRRLHRSEPEVDQGETWTSCPHSVLLKGQFYRFLMNMFDVLRPQAKDQDLSGFKQADVKTLSSHQLIEFLSLLLQEVKDLRLSPRLCGSDSVSVSISDSVCVLRSLSL